MIMNKDIQMAMLANMEGTDIQDNPMTEDGKLIMTEDGYWVGNTWVKKEPGYWIGNTWVTD